LTSLPDKHMAKFLPALLLWMFCCNCFAQKPGSTDDSSTSIKLQPTLPPAYYTEQGIKYFRTMESTVSIKVRPHYAPLVIRWEWHPWLLLTGFKRANLINSDILLKLYPTRYDTIDCRSFEKEPFCRCHVVFNYSGRRIPIYEEFTFNNRGEITFIEAWSDYPSLLPMDKKDYWAEGAGVKRLSARVPGLGNADGHIYIKSAPMKAAAEKDADLADLLHRIKHPVIAYAHELKKQKAAMLEADHPPKNDVYPYYP